MKRALCLVFIEVILENIIHINRSLQMYCNSMLRAQGILNTDIENFEKLKYFNICRQTRRDTGTLRRLKTKELYEHVYGR